MSDGEPHALSEFRNPLTLRIERTYDGLPLAPDDVVILRLESRDSELEVRFDAPYYGDPSPPALAGSTWGLWEYEVVELFLVGPRERYLEVEWGPLGHHLMLELNGIRNVVRRHLPLRYEASIADGRWHGSATLPPDALSFPIERLNAFSIHGVQTERRFRAAFPGQVFGKPDFHALHTFPTLREVRKLASTA